MTEDTTYQYRTSNGEEFWLAFDPERKCIYCEEPVGSLSMGGPALCPACDCGNHGDGNKWTHQEFPLLAKRARQNLDALAPKVVGTQQKLVHR